MSALKSFCLKHKNWIFAAYLSLIFLILYRTFLFGSAIYMYSDIGTDSVSSSYPIIVFFARKLQQADFAAYSPGFGLGSGTLALALQYINPLKLLLLLFGKEGFPIGILLQLYLQTLITAFAAKAYFRQVLKKELSVYAAATIWAFSSYVTLWSQNYSFGVPYMMFTLTIALTHHFLVVGGKKYFLLLSGCLALFFFTNYYFYYTSAVALAFYVLLWDLYHRRKFPKILYDLFRLLGAGLSSLLLAALGVAVNLMSITGSDRAGQLSFLRQLSPRSFFETDFRMISAIFLRFFSNDLIGSGKYYSGVSNYYEIGAYATSLLFTFAFFYLLFSKKTRKTILRVWTGLFLLQLLPLMGYVLNFAIGYRRYTFVICFAECICIGLFLDRLQMDSAEDREKLLYKTAASGALMIFFACLYAWLVSHVIYPARYGNPPFIDKKIALFLMSFTLFYIGLGWIVFIRKIRRFPALAGFSLLLFAELVYADNSTINHRVLVTREMLETHFYNKEVGEATEAIKKQDPGFYRIYGGTDNVYLSEMERLNQGAVQDYHSTTSRYNTPSPANTTLMSAFQIYNLSSSYFLARYPEYHAFTFLSGRYLIMNPEEQGWEPDEAFFTPLDKIGEQQIYKNRSALPFGYLYKKEMRPEDFQKLNDAGRFAAQAEAFYYTAGRKGEEEKERYPLLEPDKRDLSEENTASAAVTSDVAKSEKENYAAEIVNVLTEDCVRQNLRMTRNADEFLLERLTREEIEEAMEEPPLSEDKGRSRKIDGINPQDDTAWVDFPIHKESDMLSAAEEAAYLRVEADPVYTHNRFEIHVQTGDDPAWIKYNDFTPNTTIYLPEGVQKIRLYLMAGNPILHLTAVKVGSIRHPAQMLTDLKETNIRNISFDQSTYRAEVDAGDTKGMLCIPLLYSSHWKASVNEKEVTVQNINGGFVGLPLSEGVSRIEMKYEVPHLKAATALTLLSTLVWAVLLIAEIHKERRKKREKQPAKERKEER